MRYLWSIKFNIMELFEIIENLKLAVEENDWDSVERCINTLENIQESTERDLNGYFQEGEY